MEEKQKIKWQSNEYFHKEKTSDWFWAVGIVSVSLIIVAVLIRNYLFAVLLAIATFLIFLYATRHPKKVSFEITAKGFIIDNYFYPFESLESFSMEDSIEPMLFVKSKKFLSPLIEIPLAENDPDHIRELLLDFLEEEEVHESAFKRILEHIGF